MSILNITDEDRHLKSTDLFEQENLELIAEEIRENTIRMKRDAFHIGKLLVMAKEILRHGKFQDWVEENCGFGYSSAYNFMNVYVICVSNPKVVDRIRPSVLYMLGRKNFPPLLRDHIFDNLDILDEITNKKIKKVCSKFKEDEIDIESPEVTALFKYDIMRDQYSKYERELNLTISELEKLSDAVRRASDAIKWPILPGKSYTALTEELATRIKSVLNGIINHVLELEPDSRSRKNLKARYVPPEDVEE
jgi:hypothetical protein